MHDWLFIWHDGKIEVLKGTCAANAFERAGYNPRLLDSIWGFVKEFRQLT